MTQTTAVDTITAAVSTVSAVTADADEIVERYLTVWGEPDADARGRAVAELWAPGGVQFVEGVQFRGHDALAERIAHAYEQFAAQGEYRVSGDGHVTVHDDIIRLTIQLEHARGPQTGQVAWAARVFLVLDHDGRILQDYHVTVQPLPAA